LYSANTLCFVFGSRSITSLVVSSGRDPSRTSRTMLPFKRPRAGLAESAGAVFLKSKNSRSGFASRSS
jgi:hypothetical protein